MQRPTPNNAGVAGALGIQTVSAHDLGAALKFHDETKE
jgi:hypothetical protein